MLLSRAFALVAAGFAQEQAELPSTVETWARVLQGDRHVGYLHERLHRVPPAGFRHVRELSCELEIDGRPVVEEQNENEEVNDLEAVGGRVHPTATLLLYALRQKGFLSKPGKVGASVRTSGRSAEILLKIGAPVGTSGRSAEVLLEVGEMSRREYLGGLYRVTPVTFVKPAPANRIEFEVVRAWVDRFGRVVESELRCGARILIVADQGQAVGSFRARSADTCWFGLKPAQDSLPAAQKTPWGRIEWKESAALLHVETWPADGKVSMPRLNNPIGAVYLQGDQAQKPVAFKPNVADWTVSRPKTDGPHVIVVETVGKPRPAGDGPPLVEAGKDGTITLAAHDAASHGRMLRYEPQPHKNTVGYWADEKDWVEWRFKAKAGRYKVLLLQGCGKGQGGSTIQVSVGGQKLDLTVEDTGHFQNFVERPAGTVTLEKDGEATLEIRALKKAKAAVMDVRQVRLVPE